jgi:glycosyltransferase involved in cell wall biosynthesis
MKPRVLWVISSFDTGGCELALLNVVKEGFAKPFQDLHVLSFARGPGEVYGGLVDVLGEDHVTALSDLKHLSAKAYALHFPQFYVGLAREFANYAPDIAILSLEKATLLGRLVAINYPDTRLVTFEHNTTSHDWFSNRLMRATASGTDLVLGDDEGTLNARKSLYAPDVPVTVVPLTIIEPGRPLNSEVPATFRILSLGRVEPQKNYEQLVRAAAILLDEGRRLEITIAGEGSERPRLQRLTNMLGMAGQVRWPGHISDPAKLKDMREKGHIYIQPSRFEGLCLAFVEAMGAGMLVVGTDVGGMKTHGRDRENMIKIESTDSVSIANALRYAMDNYAELAPKLSAAAIETSQKTFARATVLQAWKETADIFSRLADRTQPGAPLRLSYVKPTPEKHDL